MENEVKYKSPEERVIYCDKNFAIVNKICGEVCSFDVALLCICAWGFVF